jgi:hypothetical protein
MRGLPLEVCSVSCYDCGFVASMLVAYVSMKPFCLGGTAVSCQDLWCLSWREMGDFSYPIRCEQTCVLIFRDVRRLNLGSCMVESVCLILLICES